MQICDYDEAYTKSDAKDIGFCGKCKISSCENNKKHITYRKFINPCKLYARIKEDKVVSINGFKLELDMITLFYGNATTGYKEESYMLYDVEIFEQ